MTRLGTGVSDVSCRIMQRPLNWSVLPLKKAEREAAAQRFKLKMLQGQGSLSRAVFLRSNM